jgi:hypothetical protein
VDVNVAKLLVSSFIDLGESVIQVAEAVDLLGS